MTTTQSPDSSTLASGLSVSPESATNFGANSRWAEVTDYGLIRLADRRSLERELN